MNIKVKADTFNSMFRSSNQIKSLDIDYLQIDDTTIISSNEIAILPFSLKKNLEQVFTQAVKQVKSQNIGPTLITFTTQGKKLAYRLNGELRYQSLQNRKVQKDFKKVARRVFRYLKTVGAIKTKDLNISSKDQKILKNRAWHAQIALKKDKTSTRERVNEACDSTNKVMKKVFKTDSEWSLWAIWFSDIKATIVKGLQMLGTNIYNVFKKLGIDLSKLPKLVQGWDDWLGYLIGGIGLYNGVLLFQEASKIQDKEGKTDGIHRIIRNTAAFIGATIDWIGKALPAIGYILAKFILELVSSVIFAFVTLYATAKYGYLEYKALKFKSKLDAYLNNDNLPEEQKIKATLKFLKRKLRVSKVKAYKILQEIRMKNPDLSDEEITKLFHEKIKNKILVKDKVFKRRVGSKIGYVIQDNIDEILKDLKNVKNIKKAELIFNKVKAKNAITLFENKWYMIAAILQGIDIMLFTVLGFSIPMLILGILCTLIFVIITGKNLYKRYYKKVDKDIKVTKLEDRKVYSILAV